MQDKDVITKEFFLADARVADFINGFLFEGHQLVRPEDIKEADSAEGLAEGLAEGETRFAALTEKLLEEKRTQDLSRAVSDLSYRAVLYREFRL